MDKEFTKIFTSGCDQPLKILPGHFATNHAHVNYYLDMTTLKTRLREAQGIARALVQTYIQTMIVDTIVCLEETEVIGAYMAEELTAAGFLSMNAHKTIYIVPPEYNSNSQMIFRENILPMIQGKNVLLLTSLVTTGLTLNKAIESVQYYGGILSGISSIFSAVDEVNGVPVRSVFGKKDLPEYAFHDYRSCPLCKQGKKLDALVNPYGYSWLQ